jgi:ATP-dependent Clp protease ATP-binding subunit ClpA
MVCEILFDDIELTPTLASQTASVHHAGASGRLRIAQYFRQELTRRFDEKIVFRPLSSEIQLEIAQLTIAEELARFRARGFDLTVSDDAFEFLVRREFQKAFGARPLKKTAQSSSPTSSAMPRKLAPARR